MAKIVKQMNLKIEYLEIFNQISGNEICLEWKKRYEKEEDRSNLIQKFSFAIPTIDAIRGITKYSPIIEIGAGAGYWAFLIEQYGGKIVAFDNNQRNKDWINAEKHEYFTKNFKEIDHLYIPRWYGLHDYLNVYKRRDE